VKVFVTGATGFVGRWLQADMSGAGHDVVPAPPLDVLDVTDRGGLIAWFTGPGGPPDAVVHLAGVAFAPDAGRDPREAFRVNVGGTLAVFEALRAVGLRPPILVSGSSDVYGHPEPADLPLTEAAPLRPSQPYALSKLAQEGVAIAQAVSHGFPVMVTRSFNHTGPGQRAEFVVPAMARRVLAAAASGTATIPAGNVDVRRDISDVRDVVRAYRLLVELAAERGPASPPMIVNVASGRSVAIRWIIEHFGRLAGVAPRIVLDPALIRRDDPEEMRGCADRMRALTGWEPTIAIEATLRDVLTDAQGSHES
jgi:GDP-4-dehydro-6-deoxy-D-mannose reductase